MKDEKEANREYIENMWQMFEEALSQRNFEGCEQIQMACGDLGFVSDSLVMHKKINAAEKNETYTWEPVEDAWSPPLLPEEAEVVFSVSDGTVWDREGDENFPRAI